MIKRNSYLEQLDKQKNIPLIKVLTGIRKCGKSTILNMFMDQFNGNDNVIYIDFNNLTYSSKIKNYLELNSYIEKRIKNNKKNFIIIDEVQEIDNFQKTINSLSLKRNNDIYITGSNSKLLSSEMSTLITGKNVKINIWPLSFKEFYSWCIDGLKINDLNEIYNNYFKYGGMPGRLLYKLDAQTEITQYLKMIYSDIIQHDILQRHDIKDVNELTNIFLYVISNIGEEFSVVNIKNYLKTHNHSNISEATISNYLSYLEETYLIRKVHKYDVVGKNILNNQYKYYAVDIGFRNANINSVTLNTGKMLENIVYNDLICKGYDVYIGKNRYIPEIDFVAKKNSETIYFQVCEHLTDDNRQREEGNLLKINDSFKKYIVSYDKFNSVEPNSGIEYINIVDWLLKN